MRTTPVALAVSKSQISAGKISAAPSPEAEPLLDGTLAAVGINANSRFFTNCYRELAANIASGEGFTRDANPLQPNSQASGPWQIDQQIKSFMKFGQWIPFGPGNPGDECRSPPHPFAGSVRLTTQEGRDIELVFLVMHRGLPA
jgi:hypothetical protein